MIHIIISIIFFIITWYLLKYLKYLDSVKGEWDGVAYPNSALVRFVILLFCLIPVMNIIILILVLLMTIISYSDTYETRNKKEKDSLTRFYSKIDKFLNKFL